MKHVILFLLVAFNIAYSRLNAKFEGTVNFIELIQNDTSFLKNIVSECDDFKVSRGEITNLHSDSGITYFQVKIKGEDSIKVKTLIDKIVKTVFSQFDTIYKKNEISNKRDLKLKKLEIDSLKNEKFTAVKRVHDCFDTYGAYSEECKGFLDQHEMYNDMLDEIEQKIEKLKISSIVNKKKQLIRVDGEISIVPINVKIEDTSSVPVVVPR